MAGSWVNSKDHIRGLQPYNIDENKARELIGALAHYRVPRCLDGIQRFINTIFGGELTQDEAYSFFEESYILLGLDRNAIYIQFLEKYG
jgi:hypothetical protein